MDEHLTEAQRDFPIWLLGDSYPGNWVKYLKGPLDPRHPTRHSIWTPIWDEIQKTVYWPHRLRVDDARLCVFNAAERQNDKEKPNKNFGSVSVKTQIKKFQTLVTRHKPVILLAFGSWAYEFARRATNTKSS
jgi:hypothetical protein